MSSVVLTVKASYIASTKYRNKSGNKEVKLNEDSSLIIEFVYLSADCSMENAFTGKETLDIN
jgi:hypothetical protein